MIEQVMEAVVVEALIEIEADEMIEELEEQNLRKEQQTEMAQRWERGAKENLKKIRIINQAKQVRTSRSISKQFQVFASKSLQHYTLF